MRLIDADALHTLLIKTKSIGELSAKKAIRYVEEAPTINAVPVIRCKDCKHYKKEIRCVGGHYNGCGWWLDEGCESPVDEDAYCSYAERKEE